MRSRGEALRNQTTGVGDTCGPRHRPYTLTFVLILLAAAACGPADTPAPTSSRSDYSYESPATEAHTPAPMAEAAFVERVDPTADCFNGFRDPLEDCAGLDLTGLWIGNASMLEGFANDPAMLGKVAVAVTFAEDLATVEDFGLCLHLDLDHDGATGAEETDMPGIDRAMCASLPGTSVGYYEYGLFGLGAERIEDESLLIVRVQGATAAFGIDPSLLTNPTGSAADAFVIYIGSARSIDELDYFNGAGPLHVPEGIEVEGVLRGSG